MYIRVGKFLISNSIHLVKDLSTKVLNINDFYLSPTLATLFWWVWEDLNLRPHAYQACALTNWATNPLSHQYIWWRMTGSNRRPPACKAGALPAELIPLNTSYFIVILLLMRIKSTLRRKMPRITRILYFVSLLSTANLNYYKQPINVRHPTIL